MIKMAIAVFVGLMLGWCFIPQPKWAQPLWDKFAGLIRGGINKFKSTPVNEPDEDNRKFKE